MRGFCAIVLGGLSFLPWLPRDSHSADQAARITVGPNVHVSRTRGAIPHNEVILAADPSHPGRLIAGSKIEYPDQPSRRDTPANRSLAYVSFDGGKTWEVTLERKGVLATDPAVDYGPDGVVYFAAFPDGGPVEVFRSGDGGRTWEGPARVGGPWRVDREYLAVDRTYGRYRGRLYCEANYHLVLPVPGGEGGGGRALEFDAVGVSSSDDGGRTFGGATTLRGTNLLYVACDTCNAVVLSDGTLVVLLGLRGTDGRVPFLPDSKRQLLAAVRSPDGGRTLSAGVPIALASSSEVLREWGVPCLATDPGSADYQDRLYVVWADENAGGSRVMLSHSKDKGLSWSAPRAISDGPESVPPARRVSILPTVAVNKRGIVGVSWYDTREAHAKGSGSTVRFSASLDGGESWAPSIRVSDDVSFADAERYRIGDTAGLAPDARGVFHALWIDNRTGIRQVWTATIDVQSRE